MGNTASRRNWIKKISASVAGLVIAENTFGKVQNIQSTNAFNNSLALIDPKDEIKITKLEIIPVHSLRTIFVKMHTDAGIIGIGEGTVEGRITTTMAAIKELEPYLIGKDPRRPAHHWQAMYRHAFYRGGIILTSALSAVDIAMWDIKGNGKKTAERIVVELKDKLAKASLELNISPLTNNTLHQDALIALTALGISRVAAEQALKKVSAAEQDLPVEELIKRTLRIL